MITITRCRKEKERMDRELAEREKQRKAEVASRDRTTSPQKSTGKEVDKGASMENGTQEKRASKRPRQEDPSDEAEGATPNDEVCPIKHADQSLHTNLY